MELLHKYIETNKKPYYVFETVNLGIPFPYHQQYQEMFIPSNGQRDFYLRHTPVDCLVRVIRNGIDLRENYDFIYVPKENNVILMHGSLSHDMLAVNYLIEEEVVG